MRYHFIYVSILRTKSAFVFHFLEMTLKIQFIYVYKLQVHTLIHPLPYILYSHRPYTHMNRGPTCIVCVRKLARILSFSNFSMALLRATALFLFRFKNEHCCRVEYVRQSGENHWKDYNNANSHTNLYTICAFYIGSFIVLIGLHTV